jgi:hypothetical protein
MDASQSPRCALPIARRLQQLYRDSLRHFDQAYIDSIITRLRSSQGLSSVSSQPPQTQAQPHKPTDADYQALLAITPESSLMISEAISVLPRFAHTSGTELEAHSVPLHVIALVEQHRDHLQLTDQDQNGFRAGLTSTKVPQLDNRAQFSLASALQTMPQPHPRLMANHQLQQPQRQGLAPQGKPNTLQQAQSFNNSLVQLVRSSTAQSMSASGVPSIGTPITGSSSNGEVQGQGGTLSASLNPSGMTLLTQIAGPRRPTPEEIVFAHRWVKEQKRTAFSRE